jgi:hypothetical protein
MSYLFQSEPKPEINRESTDTCPPFAPGFRDNGTGPIKQGGRFARVSLRRQLSGWFFRHIVALQQGRGEPQGTNCSACRQFGGGPAAILRQGGFGLAGGRRQAVSEQQLFGLLRLRPGAPPPRV